jgi:hypothetical protein
MKMLLRPLASGALTLAKTKPGNSLSPLSDTLLLTFFELAAMLMVVVLLAAERDERNREPNHAGLTAGHSVCHVLDCCAQTYNTTIINQKT